MSPSPNPVPPARPIARPLVADGSAEARVARVPKSSRRRSRLRLEGLRGSATRQAVMLRYGAYWAAIVGSSALVQALFANTPSAQSGGMWLMMSASFQCVVAAVGSVFLAPHRPEIVEQLRSYLFGYTIMPATGVALFLWFAQQMVENSTGQDVFLGTMVSALPFLYFLPVILPAIIFTKLVAGFRVVSRVSMDDEELMRIYTRNDGYQR